ncbi:MAG TPA: hypothetical protein VG826_34755 [Pirellulales bacterium]|nr:hypothetical protein [Pirellulales bacterium]
MIRLTADRQVTVPGSPHNRWRSVRQENTEQQQIRRKAPAKAAIRASKKISQAFGIRAERSNTG